MVKNLTKEGADDQKLTKESVTHQKQTNKDAFV